MMWPYRTEGRAVGDERGGLNFTCDCLVAQIKYPGLVFMIHPSYIPQNFSNQCDLDQKLREVRE